uniref:rho guanine nucleotide exchange factor 40-like n=1 Tax=Scatophagus argus TaxID=75038 RepID=UPI001ED809EA
MDSESLDRCIQTALSVLYPPFQATSPTVLCQVLSVVESYYRGDGLRYLLHFLLPAKQFLVNIQQGACLQYCGSLFRHEGWPLCIHEKVVIQLCPLDQRLLHPGDFYLLVSPPPPPAAAAPRPSRTHSASCRRAVTSCPRLLLCSVSAGSHHVEQQEVSELALRSLFSMAWMDSVNREREQRGASRLERCLLSAHGDVFRVPWEDLIYPQFISRPDASLKEDQESSVKCGDELVNTSHNPCRHSDTSTQDVNLFPSSTKSDQPPVSGEGEDSEGEYVELTELPLPRFSPQKGSLTQSISLQLRARTSTHSSAHPPQNAPASSGNHQTTNTRSSWASVEVSSHTRLRSMRIEETLSQDSCAPVILAPISPTSLSPCSSSAPPEFVETSSFQMKHWTRQEQTEGTNSGRSLKLDSHPANCTEHRGEADGEQGEEGVEAKGETEEEREEERVMEGQKGTHDILVSGDEGEEKNKELEGKECRREVLLLQKDETEDMEAEVNEEGNDEVEVEEEVQLIIVQQNQERKQEVQVMREDERKDDYRGGEQAQTHTEDSYSENTPQTHTEDSYSENRPQTHTEDSYSENTPQTHTEDSYSENTPQTHTENSYSENTPQ